MTEPRFPENPPPSIGQAFVGSGTTAALILLGQVGTGVGLVLLARALEPRVFGQFSAVLALSAIGAGIVDFGSSQLMTRELARTGRTSGFRPWLWRRTLIQSAAVPFMFLLADRLVGRDLDLLCNLGLSLQTLTISFAQGALAPVRALRSPVLAVALVSLGNLLFLGAVAASIGLGHAEPNVAAWAISGGWAISGLLGIGLCRSSARNAHRRVPPGNPWAGSRHFGFMSLALTGSSADVVLLNGRVGAAAAGELSAVAKWTQPMGLVSSAYAQFLFPKMASANSDRDAVRLLRLAMPVGVLGVLSAAATIALAPLLVTSLLGSAYSGSVVLVRLLAVAVLPALANQLLSTLLQARELERSAARAVGAATAIYLICIATAPVRWGPVTAPLSFLTAQSVLLALLSSRVLSQWRSHQ